MLAKKNFSSDSLTLILRTMPNYSSDPKMSLRYRALVADTAGDTLVWSIWWRGTRIGILALGYSYASCDRLKTVGIRPFKLFEMVG